jgi:hypothetical protein
LVGDSVGELVGDSVGELVGDSVGELVGDSVGDLVGDSVGELVGDSVGDSVGLTAHHICDLFAHSAGEFRFFPLRQLVVPPSLVLKHPPSHEPSAGQDMISVDTEDDSASRTSKLKSEITFAFFILDESTKSRLEE